MKTFANLRLERDGQLALVTLDRPDKRNALSFAMLQGLIDLAGQLRRDRTLRAVILQGEGPCFSAGIDLGDLRAPKNMPKAALELTRPGANLFQQAFLCWRDLPLPVIAVLHGHCYGAGMQLALGADFRIARPDAQLSIMEAKWGLVPDMGLSVTLRNLIGLDRAKELTMTARVISGQEAGQLGLVSHVRDDALGHAKALAAEIAERSPDAVAAAKALLNATATESASATLGLEKSLQRRLLLGKNFQIAAKRAKDPTVPWEPRRVG